ncbi:MAG: cation transporter-like permease [Paracrocinitomix sp.]|jgi:cation transporter-like permease
MKKLLSASGLLALAMLVANGAHYVLNLVLARLLVPFEFGDASLMVTSVLAFTSLGVGVQLCTVKLSVNLDPRHVAVSSLQARHWYDGLRIVASARPITVCAWVAP